MIPRSGSSLWTELGLCTSWKHPGDESPVRFQNNYKCYDMDTTSSVCVVLIGSCFVLFRGGRGDLLCKLSMFYER